MITGIAVMLSMSMMPANALPVQNVCVAAADFTISCTAAPFSGQHVMFIAEPADRINFPTAGCHYQVADLDVDFWLFIYQHGPAKCAFSIGIPRASISVVGP